MKPKLVPDLDKYFKKYNYHQSTIFSYINDITNNNLYFLFFFCSFILFLCYRYYIKQKINNNKFTQIKMRSIIE